MRVKIFSPCKEGGADVWVVTPAKSDSFDRNLSNPAWYFNSLQDYQIKPVGSHFYMTRSNHLSNKKAVILTRVDE